MASDLARWQGVRHRLCQLAAAGCQSSTAACDERRRLEFTQLVPKLFDDGTPTEATLRFANDGTMYCLQRRDGEPEYQSAFFGVEQAALHRLAMARFGHVRRRTEFHPTAVRQMDRRRPILQRQERRKPNSPGSMSRRIPSSQFSNSPAAATPATRASSGTTTSLWMSYYSSHEGKDEHLSGEGPGRIVSD